MGKINEPLWEPSPKQSFLTTIILMLLLTFLGVYFITSKNFLGIAVTIGGLGGLFHEIAQSGGKTLFIKSFRDGVYLGSISGLLLGIISGILVLRGLLAGIESQNPVSVTIEVFLAGLALKGVSEAAAGTVVEE